MDRNNANRKALLISCGAFLLQGGWAVYANHEFGWHKSLPAGLVQGVCSFAMTYACTMLIEAILSAARAAAPSARFAGAAVVSILFIIVVQSSAHWVAGTPQIVKTIFPAVIIGGIYCVVYAFGRVYLGRDRKGLVVAQEAAS